MPDSVVRQPDGQATFASFTNGVPPERFIAVFAGFHNHGPAARHVVVALMPENSLQVDAVPEVWAPRHFTLHQLRAIHIENFDVEYGNRRQDAIRAYLGLIARGIPGRLATTLQFTARTEDTETTWKLKEGNAEIQSWLTGEVVPGPAAVAPSFTGIVIVESAAQIQPGQLVLVTAAGICIPVGRDSTGPEIGRVISQSRSASRASYLTHVQMTPAETRTAGPTPELQAEDDMRLVEVGLRRRINELVDERQLLEERIRVADNRNGAFGDNQLRQAARIQELECCVDQLRAALQYADPTARELQPDTYRGVDEEPDQQEPTPEEEPGQQEPTHEEVEAEHARLRQEFAVNQMNPPELRADPDPRLTEADFDRIYNEQADADMPF
jgi:hypothetical protein